jgi:hypothetical protein
MLRICYLNGSVNFQSRRGRLQQGYGINQILAQNPIEEIADVGGI